MSNKEELDTILFEGAEKAREVAHDVMKRVRGKLGFS